MGTNEILSVEGFPRYSYKVILVIVKRFGVKNGTQERSQSMKFFQYLIKGQQVFHSQRLGDLPVIKKMRTYSNKLCEIMQPFVN